MIPPPLVLKNNPCTLTSNHHVKMEAYLSTCPVFKHTRNRRTFSVRLVWYLLGGACHMQSYNLAVSVSGAHLPVGIDLVIISFVFDC